MMEWLQLHSKQFVGDNAWIAILFVIVFLTLLLDTIQKIVLRRLQKRLAKTRTLWDDALIFAIRAPVSLVVWIVGLSFAGVLLEFKATETLRSLGIIIVVAWALVRFIRQVETRVIHAGELQENKIDRTTAYAIAQLLRISVIITAALVGLQTLGFNISAILAFGGIGGIAVGFAAKDMRPDDLPGPAVRGWRLGPLAGPRHRGHGRDDRLAPDGDPDLRQATDVHSQFGICQYCSGKPLAHEPSADL